MSDFDSDFDNIISSMSQEEAALFEKLDNPVSVAEIDSSFPSGVEITKERNMRSSTTNIADNHVEKYLDEDPENLFVQFVSDVKNYGLFAKTSFQKGDFVVFYRGTRLTREQYFEKINEKEIANEYIFTDDKNDLYIDATDVALETTGIARYANDDHRKPNMKAKKYIAVDGSKHVQFRALRNISEDEELVYDYGAKNLPWRKTVVGNVCLVPDSEGNEASKEVVTTFGSTTCEENKNESEFSQEFQYLKIRDSDDEDALSDLDKQHRGRSTNKRKNFRRSSCRLKTNGKEECVICMKRVKKIWKHLKEVHNLENGCRSFLNSYYRTRNAKSAVYECSSCLLRVANHRLHTKKFHDCKDKLTKIKEPNSVKFFPAIVQKDICTSNSKATKAALDAIREYKEDKTADLKNNQSRLNQLTNRNILSLITKLAGFTHSFAKPDGFRKFLNHQLRECRQLYASVITHASSILNFIKWLGKNKKNFRINLEDWHFVLKEWRDSTRNERKREAKTRKMNRFEKVPELNEITKILKSFEQTLRDHHETLPYNEQLAMTLFVINAATNNRPGPYLNMTREEFEKGLFREVVVGVRHKTSYKFDVGVKIKEKHEAFVSNLHEKFFSGCGQLPQLCFPNKSGHVYTTFSSDLTKLCRKKFGTECDINITVVRKALETFFNRNPNFLGSELQEIHIEQSGHDGDTAKRQYVVPNKVEQYEKLLKKYESVLYGEAECNSVEHNCFESVAAEGEVVKDDVEETGTAIAPGPEEAANEDEGGVDCTRSTRSSQRKRQQISARFQKNHELDEVETETEIVPFDENGEALDGEGDNIDSDDSETVERECNSDDSLLSETAPKKVRTNKSAIITRTNSRYAQKAFRRALQTYRQARTPWSEPEKFLIDEFLDIKELPTKTAVKDKSRELTLKKKIKFTESQIERCYQKINHAFNKFYIQKK